MSIIENGIEFHRVNNDINGNPRYVFHFLNLAGSYGEAVRIGKTVGAKKYRAKWYGGGLVIQSYNLEGTARDLLTAAVKAY